MKQVSQTYYAKQGSENGVPRYHVPLLQNTWTAALSAQGTPHKEIARARYPPYYTFLKPKLVSIRTQDGGGHNTAQYRSGTALSIRTDRLLCHTPRFHLACGKDRSIQPQIHEGITNLKVWFSDRRQVTCFSICSLEFVERPRGSHDYLRSSRTFLVLISIHFGIEKEDPPIRTLATQLPEGTAPTSRKRAHITGRKVDTRSIRVAERNTTLNK
jgi:hypothetical protein